MNGFRSRVFGSPILAIGLATATLAVIVVRIVPAVANWTTSERESANALALQLAQYQSLAERAGVHAAYVDSLGRAVQQLERGVIPATTPNVASGTLGALVSEAADASGVHVNSMSLQVDSTSGRTAVVRARVLATTDVVGLSEFLLALESSEVTLKVPVLTVTVADLAANSTTGDRLAMDIMIQGVYAPGASE